MKTKNRVLKAVAALLGGGILLGSGNCAPDNFWSDLWGGAVVTAVDTAVTSVVIDAMTPPATGQ
jgi:hypothetical protein